MECASISEAHAASASEPSPKCTKYFREFAKTE